MTKNNSSINKEITIKTKIYREHQEFIPGRGVYDKRNRLNDKTGREWRFSTKSVIPRDFAGDLLDDLKLEYPFIVPAMLARELVETFTTGNSRIFDPFPAFGSFLLGASLARTTNSSLKAETSRKATGVGENTGYRDLYLSTCNKSPDIEEQAYLIEDYREYAKSVENGSFDLLITEIPVVAEQGTSSLDMKAYSGNGVLNTSDWCMELAQRMKAALDLLKTEKYLVLAVPIDWFWYFIKPSEYIDLSYLITQTIEKLGAVLKIRDFLVHTAEKR
ncbi:MAG: hypothetical protein ACTSRU_12090 [Candidatus Hodarchaeales archaeon]